MRQLFGLLFCDQKIKKQGNFVQINPNYAEAFYQRGLCRLKLDHSKGVQDLNRALALQPNLFEAYLSRAAFYCTKKRYSKVCMLIDFRQLCDPSVGPHMYNGRKAFECIKDFNFLLP